MCHLHFKNKDKQTIKTTNNKQIFKTMKKILYSAAILAALASCSKNEVDMTPDLASQKAISFSTLNDRVASRAANDATSNYQVFAVSADGSSTAKWFMNEEIVGADNTIKSGAKYYWPTTPLAFLAIAPATEVDATTFDAAGNVTIDYTNPADGQTDLTAAQVPSIATGSVALAFKHQLAKIIVRVSLDADDVAMKDWTINTGDGDDVLTTTFTVAESEASFAFSATGALSTMTADATKTAQSLASQKVTAKGSDSDVNIIPQSSVGCKIKMENIVVKNASGEKMNTKDMAEYTIEAGNVSDFVTSNAADYFHAGRVYIMDLELSISDDGGDIFNDGITFTSTCEDWINGNSNSVWPGDDTANDEFLWDKEDSSLSE